jgi:hypothetical protein
MGAREHKDDPDGAIVAPAPDFVEPSDPAHVAADAEMGGVLAQDLRAKGGVSGEDARIRMAGRRGQLRSHRE